jgi:hypothetical protein
LNPSSVGSDRFERFESRSHLLTESLGSIREVLVDDDFESSLGDSASEGVLERRSENSSAREGEERWQLERLTPP